MHTADAATEDNSAPRPQARRRNASAPPPPTRQGQRAPQADEPAQAKARTEAFIASVRLAQQAPLAAGPPKPTAPPPAQSPRRSTRLATNALNSAIRPSKKGELLTMKKLGILTQEHQTTSAADKDFNKFLTTTMKPCHFAAFRDIFPAANNLSTWSYCRSPPRRAAAARSPEISEYLVCELLGQRFTSFAYLPSNGASGGILLACRGPELTCSLLHTGCYSVSATISSG